MPDDEVEAKIEAEAEVLNWYTLLDGSHSFRGNRARKGQEILLTEQEANKLGSRVRRSTMAEHKVTETAKPTYTSVTAVSEQDETAATAGTMASATPRDWSTSQEMKVADVIAQVNETNSVADLEALYDLEEKGQNRVTLLTHIEKRVAVLEGQQK